MSLLYENVIVIVSLEKHSNNCIDTFAFRAFKKELSFGVGQDNDRNKEGVFKGTQNIRLYVLIETNEVSGEIIFPLMGGGFDMKKISIITDDWNAKNCIIE